MKISYFQVVIFGLISVVFSINVTKEPAIFSTTLAEKTPSKLDEERFIKNFKDLKKNPKDEYNFLDKMEGIFTATL